MRYLLAIIITLLPAGAFAEAKPLALQFPVDCVLGQNCFIQKYVDLDPAQGAQAYRDYTCGSLSNDGHKGTDIRVAHTGLLEAGVKILAAADGEVLRVRNNVADTNVNEIGREAVDNVGCGNAAVIDHGGGWTSAYCHMKRGSAGVVAGDTVKAGDVIGEMGLSGLTEFPHIHFQVMLNGKVVDPFVGLVQDYTCGKASPREPLWAKEVPAYIPSGVLSAGFTSRPPKAEEVRAGFHQAPRLSANDDTIVFWADLFGLRMGDEVKMVFTDPDGVVLIEGGKAIDRHMAQWFQFVGKRMKYGAWPSGDYKGKLTITRTEGETPEVVISREWTITVD